MRDKYCQTFSANISTVPFNKHIVYNNLNENLNFSVGFWQPFIDSQIVSNSSTRICGSLLALTNEMSIKLHLK